MQNEETSSSSANLPSYWTEAKATMLLALPLIAGQLGQMLMGIADTVMIGRVGVVPLAAATFANTLLLVPFLFGVGLLSSISIRVSQGRGGGRHDEVKHALRHGTWLALGYGCLTVLLVLLLLPFLGYLGQVDAVVTESRGYFLLAGASLIPGMIGMAWKNYGDAMNRPWIPFVIILLGVALNVFLNWVCIYGNLGVPAMGLDGAGWATLISRICLAVALYFWLMHAPVVKDWSPRRWWGVWKEGEFRRLMALGIPIGLQLTAEMGAFTAASLMIGHLGAVALAAHQVAWICNSTSFMVPLGVAMAITVRMGEASGGSAYHMTNHSKKQRAHLIRTARLRRILISGWMYGLIFSGISMYIFISSGKWLAQHIVDDSNVIELATKLLIIVGMFQIGDGVQVISSSALRGMGDVKIPAIMGIFAYWCIAVPLAAYLCFALDYNAQGVWLGLAVGFVAAAIALGLRAWWMTKRVQQIPS